jgi:hypothetical protein
VEIEQEGEFGKVKYISMTDEYSADYWFNQGWTACRLAYKLHDDAEKAGAHRI